ncbi:MAG: transporter [Cupriavidus sp.]|nr:transporter [Cupriavidus sp.]
MYREAPLSRASMLQTRVASLHGHPAGTHAFTIAQIDRLVLDNNPDLMAARTQLGVAQAQILQASLLPNPQVNGVYPFLVGGPGTADGFSAGLNQDVRSLLTLSARTESAQAGAAQINASLLWQEWQVVGRARLLVVDIVEGERLRGVLDRSHAALSERYRLTEQAIRQGNATLATLSPDLLAVGDLQKVQNDLERLQLSRRQQLNALLGLAPDVSLPLATNLRVPSVDATAIRRGLADLADRRPDLIALQFGYRSQDAKLRAAILGQFPNLIVGVTGGRDTTRVYSVGPQASVDLPIFNRNQGFIAIEDATRRRLGAEFSARVTAATGEVEALLAQQAVLARQRTELRPRLEEARTIAERVEQAFKAGNFDERSYVDIAVARLSREQELIGLEQALLDGQVALATLTGAGLPKAAPLPPFEPEILPIFQEADQ